MDGILMEFLHLGYIANIYPIFKKNVGVGLVLRYPTLSPKDPNFPAWWEEHKFEWEEQTDSD